MENGRFKGNRESNAFFARKFDCNVDEEIIDYLYEKIISNKN